MKYLKIDSKGNIITGTTVILIASLILILIFVLSLLIETLFLKSLTEDDYNSLIDYSDYIVRTTYLKEEDVQTQNWNYINNIKVVIKNNFDDDEEEKSRKSTIEISLSLPKQYQELTVTYPYILDTNKNELIIGIDYKYVEKPFKKNLILIAILVDLLLVMGFETFNFKKTNKIWPNIGRALNQKSLPYLYYKIKRSYFER